MGGRDQSQVKNKSLKSSKNLSPFRKTYQKVITMTRRDSPMPPTSGLIASMERDAEEAGLGGWFNGNPEEVLESWSGSNSGASASQD